MDRGMSDEDKSGSAGHKLGQLVGDWFQDYFAAPLLQEIASRLELFLDHRTCVRLPSVRGGKLLWADDDRNEVDYDFVMELAGSTKARGVPVAFFECFWRRGSRHSKDKARDDSGKLMPMRATYPTARFLGIVAAGEFTGPAQILVRSRMIHLLYVPKRMIVDSFTDLGLTVDYSDRASELEKIHVADTFASAFTRERKLSVAARLRSMFGRAAIESYLSEVVAALSAPPVEFRIVARHVSTARSFETIEEVSEFLESSALKFNFDDPVTEYRYEIAYSNGTVFQRDFSSLDELRLTHGQLAALSAHMAKVVTSWAVGR